ncbi:uncharacterized protein OCT59_007851 [Rhizophagus irregularis]|uniref:uncharacterized protein n=1 Tax=Rhizophagus irregularis TaxID=588596 RepID=UPI0033303B38|nr:hypothetical protein OCT59_007851 [Rhizophagus irregularis]
MEFLKRIFCFPFNKTYSRNKNVIEENNKNEVVNKTHLSNLYNESNINFNDLNLEQYVQDNQPYGLCSECNRPNTKLSWCKECYSNKFQQNFDNWTSGNKQIDEFIQESQLNARAQGGFSTIYKAIWLDGGISRWDYEKQGWKRYVNKLNEQDYKDVNNSQIKNPLKIDEKYGFLIVLKSLNDSSNINEDFLNEWKLHLQCQHEAYLNDALLTPIIGITKDPDTLNYMIIMQYLPKGSLRDNLLIKKYNPNDKFNNLGIRPEIIEGTMPEYVELMKRCWDNNPEKRPTVDEVEDIFGKWDTTYSMEEEEEKRIPVPENEPEIAYHLKSCYTSRKFNYSAKLNEMLSQDELSNKIVIIDDKNDDRISKELDEQDELDDCII